MFSLERFYQDAHSGKAFEAETIFSYIRQFKFVVLWGAGNLGTEVGERLLAAGVSIAAYWDMNYEKISICNGIRVMKPLTGDFDHNTTLVISCIVNGSLGSHWTERELEKAGYHCYLSGMAFYEGVICPLSKDFFDIRECTNRKACSLCNCERYTSLLSQKLSTSSSLTFQLMTFIISTRCSLNCKYCGQRLSEYPPEDKVDFTFENIKRDIDHFMSAVDFVGMISIIGGEPFLHPDLVAIVKHCLTKDNFGVVNITTNGIVKLTEELLCELKDRRVKISFSIYDTYLTEKQKELLEKNIEMVRCSGISFSLSHPLWVKPGELKDYAYQKEYMKEKKKNCDSIKMCAAVRNGVFYPCSTAENIESLHKFQAGNSAVNVKEKKELCKRLKNCLAQEYFEACRYCSSEAAQEITAGEQA